MGRAPAARGVTYGPARGAVNIVSGRGTAYRAEACAGVQAASVSPALESAHQVAAGGERLPYAPGKVSPVPSAYASPATRTCSMKTWKNSFCRATPRRSTGLRFARSLTLKHRSTLKMKCHHLVVGHDARADEDEELVAPLDSSGRWIAS